MQGILNIVKIIICDLNNKLHIGCEEILYRIFEILFHVVLRIIDLITLIQPR